MPRQWAIVLLFIAGCCAAQNNDSSYHQLQVIEIKPESDQSALRLMTSETTLNYSDLQKQSSLSFLPAVNNVPGVRMEERSPGSYRLSIRGSLLRSPFGVRNIKIYLGDLPFTDAGGNTYLNSLDIGSINGLKILKGPEASIFGANTGGVLLIDPVEKSGDSLKISATVTAGSFGLFHENFRVQIRNKKSFFSFSQGYQTVSGYRKNSAMRRHYAQASEIFKYRSKAQLRFLVLASDLCYQTPGGLSFAQYKSDPTQARPATSQVPGAIEQKAAIYNKTIFGGLTHDVSITRSVRHVASLFTSRTDFKNPFITNFEQRMEASAGLRTYLEGSFGNVEKVKGKWDIGAELQQNNADISNFGNNKGIKDTIQSTDRLNARQAFIFALFQLDIKERLLVEASASYNFFSYQYKNVYPLNVRGSNTKTFVPQFMPKIAASFKISKNISWRASLSRGYSPPTLAEIRSSDNIINTALEPESGINYESGIKLVDNKSYLLFDAAVFYYSLKNAIVRRVNSNGIEYFVNAGGTKQPGLETQLSLWIIQPRTSGWLRSLQLKGNFTLNRFTFDNYSVASSDYSGKKLTGVPDHTSAESIFFEFPANFTFYAQYYYASAIPLNDANTEFAGGYHLVQLKTEWKTHFKKLQLSVFCGIDNVLNHLYSLGNDLNAFGGRYYNAAMPRNYYGGFKIGF